MAEYTIFKQRFLTFCLLAVLHKETARVRCDRNTVPVHYLAPGDLVNKIANDSNTLEIFCYKGYHQTTGQFFSTVVLQLQMKRGTQGYHYYQAPKPEDIMIKYEEEQSPWSISTSWYKHTSNKQNIVLNTFKQECIAVKTLNDYSVVVTVINIDFSKIGLLCCGLLLFFFAPRLSHNDVFFYVCGVSLGVTASFLVISYFISKLIPKKSLMIGAIVSSWSLGFFVLKYLFQNFQFLMKVYFHHVMCYVLIAGFVSFAVCYRVGPPSNPRSKNLIKWSLQGCSLGLIWNCSSHEEMKCAVIFIVFLVYNFPSIWVRRMQTYWLHKFPPKQQFLTEEEFIEQGAKETQKALGELKDYCRSPKCNQWNTVLNVKNPRRFAEFMSGAPHITNEELLSYELHSRSIIDDIYTDDSSQSDEDEEILENNLYSSNNLESNLKVSDASTGKR